MLVDFFQPDPLAHIKPQHLVEQVLCFVRELALAQVVLQQVRLHIGRNSSQYLHASFAIEVGERELPPQHIVQHHSHAPNVHGSPIVAVHAEVSRDDLPRDIHRGPNASPAPRKQRLLSLLLQFALLLKVRNARLKRDVAVSLLRWKPMLRQTKVAYLHPRRLALVVDQHVRQLQVPVGDVVPVAVGHAAQDLLEEIQAPLLVQVLPVLVVLLGHRAKDVPVVPSLPSRQTSSPSGVVAEREEDSLRNRVLLHISVHFTSPDELHHKPDVGAAHVNGLQLHEVVVVEGALHDDLGSNSSRIKLPPPLPLF
mmetsp:Transcript_12267/g.23099  ORF Transcript_12267/g.23099 Transcript_12267/m.23099 type:complete len:310 (+) Transcript_12267:793-1722(+)